MAGSDVSDAIDKDSGRMYSAGHAFCKAVDVVEGDVTIGYSSASKVWSSAYKDLKDYIQWCEGLGKKITNKKIKVKTIDVIFFLIETKKGEKSLKLTTFPNCIITLSFQKMYMQQ